MKLSALHQSYINRRNNSFRGEAPLDLSVYCGIKLPATIFWLVFHGLCCIISLVMGFRFSRLLVFLIFSTSTTTNLYSNSSFWATEVPDTLTVHSRANKTVVPSSRVVVGRHGILIRPWPHPDSVEVMKAHRIIDIVQREQRLQYGVNSPRTVIAITPTYVRTFQTLHLTGVMHSLMNAPYDVIWIVVEAGGTTNETASLIAKSGLRAIHIGFTENMTNLWEVRHGMEVRMRLRALRVVREEKLDGIVMFADDSNMHSMGLFDEIQKVKWIAAVSVGIPAHSSNSDEEFSVARKDDKKNSPMPVQGPACNSSDQLVGWHTVSFPFVGKSAKYIGDNAIVLPRKLEWAGFVLNSRLVWKEGDKPGWVKDLSTVSGDGNDIDTPLSLLNDPSVVEPLGSCGRKILLWWLRVEARADSRFPAGWIIDPQLDVTVPSNAKTIFIEEKMEKPVTKTPPLRSKHSSRSKRKQKRKVD